MKITLLLSIKPKMAEAILNGSKKWEYRKVAPQVEIGSRVIIYASRHCKEIVGEFVIAKILKEPVDLLIEKTIAETPHKKEEIYSYFAKRKIGYALKVENPLKYDQPISLTEIRKMIPGFLPPQNYRYLKENDIKLKPILELVY
jgi:predicted transcriptional regulator